MLDHRMPIVEPPSQHRGGQPVDERLDELERHSELHARTMEELDNVVREFAERVSRLERELKDLRAQLELLSSADDDDDDEPDPPGPS